MTRVVSPSVTTRVIQIKRLEETGNSAEVNDVAVAATEQPG